MKHLGKLILLPLLFVAASAVAQTSPPAFSHIVIIVQENRTPDNLFGAKPTSQLCTSEDPFEPGVDIVQGGLNLASKNHNESYSTCLAPNSGLINGGG